MSSIIFSGDANKGMKIMEAGQWNNQANQLEARGDFTGAEGLFLRSLARKIEITGEDSIQTALARNSLGELYLKMEGKLDDAQKMLEEADRIRSVINDFDAACTRDNLGQLWEMKGDVVKAREARERNPENMICSNFNVSVFSV
ncbi:putative tetratricopeptide repeat family protein [Botrytis cinerea BcDW1]|uniref:Putative tetratricopeptide repeat family protein n=1 Tax=Botryotinia fuckeliana (strain BcDW1) TaxID=1290391 RepID=M7U9C5_BOTF1|nr:putative tetratricopeptide repeat family protein [Botrytis cinerea BcDW1]